MSKSVFILSNAMLFLFGCGKLDSVSLSGTVHLVETKIDKGVSSPGLDVSSDWILVNETGGDVKLKQLVLSCACMSTDFESGVLPAGERRTVRVWVNDPPDGVALQTGRFVVEGNTVPIVFEWRYRIEQQAKIEPSVIHLGDVWLDESATNWAQTLEISTISEFVEPMQIMAVSCECAAGNSVLNYSIEAEDRKLQIGTRLKLLMSPETEPQMGTFSDSLIVKIHLAERIIPMRLMVAGSLFNN